MNRILILITVATAIFTSGCSHNIDESILRGSFEAAYYFHSGGTLPNRFITITVVINQNGGALKREERSVIKTDGNRESLAHFTISNADLKKLHELFRQQDFYGIKTVPIDDPGARTLYLKIKAGGRQYIREESPVVSIATTPDRQKFMAIASGFNAFVKDRLPAKDKRLIDH